MCLFSAPKPPPPPQLPPETQAMKEPDGGQVSTEARRRTTDRLRSAAKTILTSGQGATDSAITGGATVLGA